LHNTDLTMQAVTGKAADRSVESVR
jgi:hypothetical protein